jgi:hypothetical protein
VDSGVKQVSVDAMADDQRFNWPQAAHPRSPAPAPEGTAAAAPR